MKYELPCEIVKDLLPSYIDELTGASTEESVKAHINECRECQKMYENMKSEMENPQETGEKEDNDDRKLYQKIKKQLHKKVWIAVGMGIVAVLLVIGMEELLYGAYIEEVPYEYINVSATVDTIEEYKEKDLGEDSVFYAMTDSGEYMDDWGNTMPQNEEVDYLTTIEIESPYILKDMLFLDVDKMESEGVLYVEYARTTILNNQLPAGKYSISSTYFGKLEKIVYLDGDKEVILWERKLE